MQNDKARYFHRARSADEPADVDRNVGWQSPHADDLEASADVDREAALQLVVSKGKDCATRRRGEMLRRHLSELLLCLAFISDYSTCYWAATRSRFAAQVNFKATANGHPKGANPLNNSDTEVREICRYATGRPRGHMLMDQGL